ncbi:hypothetical protein [Streptomyces sp. CBMA152]|uniref:hypothetical protein n=1 Tax=Streptomyces sp. CBMA152 TaxID=1896312 RepID=UPI001660B8A6|nr:hypothetical protein [Streptomyces sp. CBMA152]MBD0746213.1 hypothetical protein [Streptomyces sp. CBMA152]
MAVTDELRNVLTDPKPGYFVAGALDLGVKQAAKVPALVDRLQSEVPARFEAVRNTDPKAVQDKVVDRAKEAQAAVTAKVNEVVGVLDGDVKKLGDSVQHLALQVVGFTAEGLVKAREGYEKVAEHGKVVVKEWRGEASEEISEIGQAVAPKESETSESDSEPAASSSSEDSDAKPAAKKTTARKSTAKKTAAKPSE